MPEYQSTSGYDIILMLSSALETTSLPYISESSKFSDKRSKLAFSVSINVGINVKIYHWNEVTCIWKSLHKALASVEIESIVSLEFGAVYSGKRTCAQCE